MQSAAAQITEDRVSENWPMICAALGVVVSGVLCVVALAAAVFLTVLVGTILGTGEMLWFLPIAALLCVAAFLPFWAIRVFWKANASLPDADAPNLRASARKLRVWASVLLTLWLLGAGVSATQAGLTGEEIGWNLAILALAATPIWLLGGLLNNTNSPIGPHLEKAD
ncbi:MAG: hypothetical protein HKO95_09450 [Rhodobacteraceae bacterium]|nr:hypothetical protein [Alphaproteobacteria bacterium]MBT8474814.1 hypothetical protein [Alphaproteobacteria bacterium]NNK66950.1 hypothetical protein [Paracoccaceae bacterium]